MKENNQFPSDCHCSIPDVNGVRKPDGNIDKTLTAIKVVCGLIVFGICIYEYCQVHQSSPRTSACPGVK